MPPTSLPVLQEVRTSNMVTYRKCKRKAYLEVVCGEKKEGADYFDFGTIVHKMLENWLQSALLPPAGSAQAAIFIDTISRDPELSKKLVEQPSIATVLEASAVAKKGIHLLPAPGRGLVVEEPFSVQLSNGVLFKSHGIDLYDTRPTAYHRLLDHKTCKNLKHVPTSEEQKDNVQLISYGHELMRRNPDWGDLLRTRWIYYPRSYEAAVAVDCDMTRYELKEKWAAIVADVDEFKHTAEALAGQPDGWKQVEPNFDHCGDYRGCQFRSRCSSADIYAAWGGEEQDVGLMDRARNGEAVGMQVSAPVPQPGATPQVAQGGVSLFAAKRQAAPPPPPPAAVVAPLLAGTGIQSAPEGDEVDDDGDMLDEGGAVAGEVVLPSPLPLAADGGFQGVLPPDAAPPSVIPPEPKKRGRKAKAVETVAEVSTANVPAAVSPVIPSPSVEIDPTPPTKSDRGTIVKNLRDQAEKLAQAGNHTSDDQALALFIAAQRIERGEL